MWTSVSPCLQGGRLLMFFRTSTGFAYMSTSDDKVGMVQLSTRVVSA